MVSLGCIYSRFFSFSAVIILLIIFSCSPLYANSKIYVSYESDGTIKFSTRPPTGGQNAKVFESRKVGFSWYKVIGGRGGRAPLYKGQYDHIIKGVAQEYRLDPSLLKAVIHVESAYNPKAVSPKGALGLMQIMPFNLKRLGVKDPFEPDDNVRGGAKLLASLKRRYGGNLRLALAAYNAGEGAVAKYKGIPPYRETQHYVRKVLEFSKRYSQKIS